MLAGQRSPERQLRRTKRSRARPTGAPMSRSTQMWSMRWAALTSASLLSKSVTLRKIALFWRAMV